MRSENARRRASSCLSIGDISNDAFLHVGSFFVWAGRIHAKLFSTSESFEQSRNYESFTRFRRKMATQSTIDDVLDDMLA